MKRAWVVLGMHRSGTSSLAGALARLGPAAPRTLMPAAEDNPRGFWESEVVMALNDRMLDACGSGWADWRALEPAPLRSDQWVRAAARVLADEFGDAPDIVLKDPRMCRLWPLWRAALERSGYDPRVVLALRDPGEVAASLAARNGLSRAHGLRLWMRHGLDAERATRGRPRAVVAWSDLLADWRGALAGVEARLGPGLRLNDPAATAAVDAFLTPDLRRQRTEDAPIPPDARRLMRAIASLGRHGEHPDTRVQIDAVAARFDAAQGLFDDAANRPG